MEVGFYRASNAIVTEQRTLLPRWLWIIICTAFFVFWGCSAFRHFNFCSEAFDLGIFSQAAWLISEGEIPFSSLLHKHILGDHGAYVLYVIGFIYYIFPTAYTLLAIQALVLALTAWPTYLIAKTLQISEPQVKTLCILSILHPTLFNSNLFDFHPDAIVVPGILFGFYFAITKQTIYFILTTILVVLCKEVFSLVVVSLGGVLFVLSDVRRYGVYSIFMGVVWFILMLWLVIPEYSPTGLPAGSERYFQFRGSATSMLVFFLSNLMEVLYKIHWVEVLNYLKGLILPILPLISSRGSLSLVGAAPIFILNCISTEQFQRNYSFHHSLPIIPFLIISCMYSSTINRYKTNMVVLCWSLVIFIFVLGKGVYSLGTNYPFTWYRDGTIASVYAKAISFVGDIDAVIAPSYLVPHLANRRKLSLLIGGQHDELDQYDVVIIDSVNPGWGIDRLTANKYLLEIKSNRYFSVLYENSDVHVFRRKIHT